MFGIAPQYYLPIYYGIVTILSLLVFSQYESYTNDRLTDAPNQRLLGVGLTTALMTLFIGLRPVSDESFVDMANYAALYDMIKGNSFSFISGPEFNFIFDNLLRFFASINLPAAIFFLTIAAIYFIGIAWACAAFFPKDRMAALLVYLSAFSTFAYGTTGIKAGAAASLFLVALAFYQKREWVWVILFAVISAGFHHSMIVPISAFAVCIVIKNPRVYFAFWVVCFFISLFHVTFFQELLGSLINDHDAEYLIGSGRFVKTEFLGGFRLDFVLYSAVPMVLGLVAVGDKRIDSDKYVFLLNLYTLINGLWLLCMYSDFTNRIAYLSWMLLPIVLVYPLLNEDWEGDRYRVFQWIAYAHLAFNLIMELFYW